MKRPTPFRGWAVHQGCSLLVVGWVSGISEDRLSPSGDRRDECSKKSIESDDSALGGKQVLLRLIQLLGQNVDVLLKLLDVLDNEIAFGVDLRGKFVGVSHADLGVQHRPLSVKRSEAGSA